MLIDQIRVDLTTAMKAKDTVRQRTLRSVIAAVQEAQVAGDSATTLDDDGVQAVLKSQVKRRVDAAEAFEAGGADDRAADERAEIEILETYLPAALSADELDTIVSDVFSANGFETMADMGSAMKAVNAEVAGRADGRAVADLVKSRLS
ncbi:GatB/YqeY domain-containing protein [Ilumatobacter nonamiensis]|uniref:GatB/YqeY domain-containing protein n=1 Tax=Ilumatobacter nonamiensis TaxID=467093 RepID=UPI00058D553A|nr:GatB/YqeY domain-containing protein [Ilumatobacter nonamiensis]